MKTANKSIEENPTSQTVAFLESESTCCLCGSLLTFSYRQEEEQLLEEGFCKSCDIRAKKRTHPIQ